MAKFQPSPYSLELRTGDDVSAEAIWNRPANSFLPKWGQVTKSGELPKVSMSNGLDSARVNVFNMAAFDIEVVVVFPKLLNDKDVSVGRGPSYTGSGSKSEHKPGPVPINDDYLSPFVPGGTFRCFAGLQNSPSVIHLCTTTSDSSSYTLWWRRYETRTWAKGIFSRGDNKTVINHVFTADDFVIKQQRAVVTFDCDKDCDDRCPYNDTNVPSDYYDDINKQNGF